MKYFCNALGTGPILSHGIGDIKSSRSIGLLSRQNKAFHVLMEIFKVNTSYPECFPCDNILFNLITMKCDIIYIFPLATTIQYKRYGLVCKGNPSFESCVEGKS